MIHPIELHSTQAVWVVSCNGPCSQIGAELRTFFGDADLYANEDEQPTIATMGYNCPTCSMCEAVDGDQDDECPNMSITGERHVLNVTSPSCNIFLTAPFISFFLMVVAYSSYSNMRLQLFGSNVNSVTSVPPTTPRPTTTPSGGGGNAAG